jgi:cytochrome c oxidase cbb3-type subunit 3
MRNKIKYTLSFLTALLFAGSQPVWAADPPGSSPFSNPLAVTLFILMLLLLIIIGVLANVLLGTADLKMKKKQKKDTSPVIKTLLIVTFILGSISVFAQGAETAPVPEAAMSIGGMSASVFYIMTSIIFLELFIIIALLINIKFLIRTEKENAIEKAVTREEAAEMQKNKLSWWARFNKLRPISQEAELDLGHEYDGIRELNNRLPPWWLYGFYITIIFAIVYLWRFNVSHTGPSSVEEYESAVARAEIRIQEYLKAKGESVDENSVTVLTAPDEIAAGKSIFIKSCAVCHKEDGGGLVGPNLTDDYSLHGNDIKSIFKTIRYGINAMPQWQNTYSNKQIAEVASYVKSLHGTNPPGAKAPDGVLEKPDSAPASPVADSVVKENKIVLNK